jgi:eukaryotic-like serine/threonine-protein kinase
MKSARVCYESRMRTGSIVLISALTAAATSAATFFGLKALTRASERSEEAEVPPLVGLEPDQARKILDPRGLTLIIAEHREDERTAGGLIIQQAPFEGVRAKRGTGVRVTVSSGQGRVEVPPIARLPLTSARQILAGVGLKPGGVVRQPSADIPTDQVIASTPSVGERVARGATVNLIVSIGSGTLEEVTVPHVVGKGLGQATKELTRSGLTLGKITYGSDEDRRGGVVIRQSPAANARAPRGSAVQLVVNENE